MAAFGGLTLTNSGKKILAKAQAGQLLNFKKAVLGDGELSSSEDIENITQLKNQVLICNISEIQVTQDEIATITFDLNNRNLETGFYWKELGIIAEEPDTKEEILYCYGNARENGEYISATGGADILEKKINVDLIVSNAKNISAIIDRSLVYVSKQEFDEKISNINSNISSNALHCKTLTLSVANWTQNETTQLYEYNITDSTITANHLIERSYGLN